MECEVCAVLESIRCDRIMKYVLLVEQMKRYKRQTAKLQAAISNLRSEADEAWKRLDAHRRLHALGSDCAADLETGRKPAQREDSELKAKTATAG